MDLGVRLSSKAISAAEPLGEVDHDLPRLVRLLEALQTRLRMLSFSLALATRAVRVPKVRQHLLSVSWVRA